MLVPQADGCFAQVQPVDRWSPSMGRWVAGVNPFFAWCFGLARPRGQGAPQMLMETTIQVPNLAWRALQVARMLRLEVVRTADVILERDEQVCRADVMVLGKPMVPPAPSEVDGFFTSTLNRGVLVVPARLGAARSFLDRLAGEFQAAPWALTALAVASVAALASCWSAEAAPAPAVALLRTLAPLLAQPVPVPRSARPCRRHPMFAVWLYACLVLGAFYQSQLLNTLYLPHRAEIASIQEFTATGLPLLSSLEMNHVHCKSVPSRRGCFREYSSDVRADLMRVAVARDAGLLLHVLDVPVWVRDMRALHLVAVNDPMIRSQFYVPRGSRLAEPLRLAIARISDSGIMRRWTNWNHLNGRCLLELPRESAEAAEPLRVAEALPALVVLAAGLFVAAAVLVAELATHHLSRARTVVSLALL
ncbi:Glutamate receptor 2 [Frankliniella fusca]|uniref:Glutamate receptor 2 n=1 Tax=Frankliniella fusca TaxID=407009 RepID=A0AAE1H987_9NEOP|nr:Glutamate receptor 2 [Frankliniella fusca]